MKVLILNGSPRVGGNTTVFVDEMVKVFDAEGVECEVIRVGNEEIRGCNGCNACGKLGKCVYDDIVNELVEKLVAADGFVAASPVYYGTINGTLASCLSRMFYSCKKDLTMKVGAGVVCARRSGCSEAFDQLNKYFAISGMPIATSIYWNNIHGRDKGDAVQDGEGLLTARTLARNMTFLMRSIALGREKYGLPEKEPMVRTDFI